MIVFYNIVAYVLFLLALPFLPFLWLFSEKRKANLIQRFGFKTGFENLPAAKNRIWIHALSVGEVVSAIPFLDGLKKKYPELEIVFTASTKTGFDMASEFLLKEEGKLADHLGYFPFDLKWCVKRMQRLIQPNSIVIIETDLWPNFLNEMNKKKIPVILVNARMSEQSLKGFSIFKSLSSMFFSPLDLIMAQSALDKSRFESLDIKKNKVVVSGNIKFDQTVPRMNEDDIYALKTKLGIKRKSQVFIGGSTHEGEEKILLSVYKKLKEDFAELILILAPRDPKRATGLQSLCESHHMKTQLYSDVAGPDNSKSGPIETGWEEMEQSFKKTEVILVDQMGVLAKLYAVCDAAFIGGSMVAEGGHNPLEAAAFSKPIVFGMDMSDFVEISELLLNHGGAKQVADEKELERTLFQLLNEDEKLKLAGKKNHQVFLDHSGAVQYIIEQMEQRHIV